MDALIIDTDFKPVALVDGFDTFIWTDRYSEYGDFELYPALNEKNLTDLKEDYYVITKDSDHVMIIEDVQIDSNVAENPVLTVTGRSLETILYRRIVWKTTVLSGNLQEAIKKILDENLISPEDENRKIENFIFEASADESITSLELSAEVQFTGDYVYDVVKVLCDVYGLGFKVTLSDDNMFVFKLYSGVDRSYDQDVYPYVVFSPKFDNLINSSYLRSKKSLKTVTLVAGEGEGSERTTVTVEASDGAKTGIDRRELYTDARDLSRNVDGGTLTEDEYKSTLEERGREKLVENSEIKSFDGQSDPDMNFKVGKDYFIGDIVQIENEYGLTAKSRVTEIMFSENSSGFEMYPTFTKVE